MGSVECHHIEQDVRTIAEARQQKKKHDDEDRGYEGLVVRTDNLRQADRMMSHGWVVAIDHADGEYDAPLSETGAAIYHFYERGNTGRRALLEDDPEQFVTAAIHDK